MKNIENVVLSGSRSLEEELDRLAGQLSYPETAYYLPISYALTGIPVRDGDTARDAYEQAEKNTLIAGECIMASRKERAPEPYTGFIGDTVLRRLGYSLVDGSILGLGLLAGTPSNVDAAAAICREMQEKYLLTFLAGEVIPLLQESGVKVGLEYRLVPLGPDGAAAIHFTDIIARVAMMFGGVQPGDAGRLLTYAKERAKAFIIAFPGLEDTEIAVLDAMRVLGIPVLTPGGYTGEEWIPAKPDEAVRRGMELRDIRVNVVAIPIPMACSPAFEGKSIRKEETYVEFGGGRSPAFELLRMRPPGEVQDGRVEVVGPEVGAVKEGSALPLALLVDVAGKKMKKEYEPVFERRIHTFLNYGEGSWHVAQRDLIWVRISKEAVKKGVKIKDLGTLLASKFRMDFPDHIDAVQVTLITEEARVRELLKEAEKVYEERDARLEGMKDEDVDTFYSCTLCQTFAPNHVCIITPERPALCGAITWLDAKIAHEISPSGANQPVPKGEMIDEVEGEFVGVNRFVKKASHGEVSRCALYTIMNNPMTSCGCFECIAAIVPEVNGILIVNRDYQGQTPLGMTFSTLAGTIGGGSQTPGFVGISKNYILSERFLAAENGILRVVWMPSTLKEELGPRLQKAIKER
ncbi:MAG: acetyl-CoA decarbonylase/synthase complex subunit alpha/beta, partial [Methanomicrobiaceae archaeon]|nr:acetyl-CoA decarbonylase/synthase complex subunit alpha/beta [Methanomicrobiaceae archaeon]